jgi:hypothetical protein
MRLPCSCGELCYFVSLAKVAQLEAVGVLVPFGFMQFCVYVATIHHYLATSQARCLVIIESAVTLMRELEDSKSEIKE